MRRASLLTKILYSVIPLVALASCSKDTGPLLDPSRVLSAVAADEAIQMAGGNKNITVIVPAPGWEAVTLMAKGLEAEAKKRGISVATKATNVGDPMKGDFGWKSADFINALAAAPDTGAIVSLAGAPLLKPAEIPRVPSTHPPILIVATAQLVPGDQMQLARLLDAKIIQAAIIDGGDPSATKSAKADATHELFAQNYRILRRPD
jgi:hypothetical protein